jgi:sugar phosphate permease
MFDSFWNINSVQFWAISAVIFATSGFLWKAAQGQMRQGPLSLGPKGTWALISLFYSFQFFLRSAPNAMSDPLMREFGINAKQLGVFSSMYYIPYAFLQIPLGIAIDVWGPKRILRIGTTICVLGAALFSISTTFQWALLGRFLIGMGAAASFIGSIRMNTLWFSISSVAFATGILSGLGKMGGVCANAILPQAIETFGSWQGVLRALCWGGCVLTFCIWLFVKNGPQDRFVSGIQKAHFSHIKGPFLRTISTPTLWAMGIYGYSLYLTLTVFSDTYSINFLATKLSISRENAGWFAGLVGVGSALGSSLLTWASDYFKQRLFFVRLCAVGTLSLSIWIFWGPSDPIWGTATALFFFGFFSGGQILAFIVSSEKIPKAFSGMAVGVTNALLMAGGVIQNPILGWILQRGWDGKKTVGGIPIYALSDYQMALSSLSLCFFVAVVISFFVKESHPHRQTPNCIAP